MKPTERDKTTNPQELDKQLEQLQTENERLKREIERLREELAKALRLAKRQAAPFSRGEPKAKPKRSGRKPGARYGTHQRRKPPSQVDEAITVPMPQQCSCGGVATWERTQTQFQEDIVIRTVRRRFDSGAVQVHAKRQREVAPLRRGPLRVQLAPEQLSHPAA